MSKLFQIGRRILICITWYQTAAKEAHIISATPLCLRGNTTQRGRRSWGKGRKRKMAATQLPSCHHLSPVTFFQWGCHYSNLMHSFCQFCSANMQRVRHCKIGPSRFQMSHQALHVFLQIPSQIFDIYDQKSIINFAVLHHFNKKAMKMSAKFSFTFELF